MLVARSLALPRQSLLRRRASITDNTRLCRTIGGHSLDPVAEPSMPPVTMAHIKHIPASSLHVSKPTWWLESRFHLAFADYYDRDRMQYGVLRVVNDDLVKPRAGFGTHPHRDAEIFSYVLDGELSHADSMGNKEALGRGSVQYMSAGTGVSHSEMNDGGEVCRFMQLWITPDRRGHTPQYGSTVYDKADRHNRLLRILGGTGPAPAWPSLHSKHAISLHADANVVVSEADPGTRFELEMGAGRQAYVVCMEGGLSLNATKLEMRDGARVFGDPAAPSPLTVTVGPQGAHLMMVEMKLSD